MPSLATPARATALVLVMKRYLLYVKLEYPSPRTSTNGYEICMDYLN